MMAAPFYISELHSRYTPAVFSLFVHDSHPFFTRVYSRCYQQSTCSRRIIHYNLVLASFLTCCHWQWQRVRNEARASTTLLLTKSFVALELIHFCIRHLVTHFPFTAILTVTLPSLQSPQSPSPLCNPHSRIPFTTIPSVAFPSLQSPTLSFTTRSAVKGFTTAAWLDIVIQKVYSK